MVRVVVEIAAPPEKVREVVLDFAHYPDWHTSFLYYIEPNPNTKEPYALVKVDTLKAGCPGVKEFHPTVVRNDSSEFRWRGSVLAGAFAGEHYFSFLESKVTPGGTTFAHGEEYDGWLKVLYRPGWPLYGIAYNMFEAYSKDLKARVEGAGGK